MGAIRFFCVFVIVKDLLRLSHTITKQNFLKSANKNQNIDLVSFPVGSSQYSRMSTEDRGISYSEKHVATGLRNNRKFNIAQPPEPSKLVRTLCCLTAVFVGSCFCSIVRNSLLCSKLGVGKLLFSQLCLCFCIVHILSPCFLPSEDAEPAFLSTALSFVERLCLYSYLSFSSLAFWGSIRVRVNNESADRIFMSSDRPSYCRMVTKNIGESYEPILSEVALRTSWQITRQTAREMCHRLQSHLERRW